VLFNQRCRGFAQRLVRAREHSVYDLSRATYGLDAVPYHSVQDKLWPVWSSAFNDAFVNVPALHFCWVVE
jgi:hypothetical protein